MERSGNFIDWCLHLMKLDPNLAKKQFGALHRQLCKAASKFSRSGIKEQKFIRKRKTEG